MSQNGNVDDVVGVVDDDDSDSDLDSSMEASRNSDEHRSQGELTLRKKPSSHGLGHRDHEARPHSVLVPSATTLTRDTEASAPPFHTKSQRECTGKKKAPVTVLVFWSTGA